MGSPQWTCKSTPILNGYPLDGDAENQGDDRKGADEFALHRGEKSGAL